VRGPAPGGGPVPQPGPGLGRSPSPRPAPAILALLALLLAVGAVAHWLPRAPAVPAGPAGPEGAAPGAPADLLAGLAEPAPGAVWTVSAALPEPPAPAAGAEPDGDAPGEPISVRSFDGGRLLARRVAAVHAAAQVTVRGIYIPAAVTGETAWFNDLIDLVRRTELNAVVIDFKDDLGYLVAGTPFPEAEAVGAVRVRFRDAARVLEALRDEGIYTIARVVTFKDNVLAGARPDLAVQLADGRPWRDRKGTAWLNPYHPGAWEYNIQVAREAALLGFREVQFDYVRFPSDGPVRVAVYPGRDERTPSEVIGGFLRAAREALEPYNVMVSADVFGQTPSVDGDMGIGQRWEDVAWGIHYISPMAYPSHYAPRVYGLPDPDAAPYETVLNTLQDALERRPHGEPAVIRPWLQDFSLRHRYGPAEVRAQIQAVYDAGLEQWLLWNPAARYTEAALLPAGAE